MRLTHATRHGRLAATVVGFSFLVGCGGDDHLRSPTGGGIDLNYIGFPCDPGGAHFDEPGTFSSPLPLPLGRPQIATATLEVTTACPGAGTFMRLEWEANFSTPGRILRARLVGCEACTVIYDEQESPYGQSQLKGAAVLHFPRQRLAFEVTGTAAGLGDLVLFACLNENCTAAANAATVFRVR